MSRGISWRQRSLLEGAANCKEGIIAWCELDYGFKDMDDDWPSGRTEWNHEQTVRRALRSLEKRGLVELNRYVFFPEPTWNGLSTSIKWEVTHPDRHIPGQTKIMTGVKITDAGRAVLSATTYK